MTEYEKWRMRYFSRVDDPDTVCIFKREWDQDCETCCRYGDDCDGEVDDGRHNDV